MICQMSDAPLELCDSDSSEVHINRMLQILKEFSADLILSSYVISDVWDYMVAMKGGEDGAIDGGGDLCGCDLLGGF
ncbi:hypothetical protein ACS0TY_024905 [Phlomoides rotata]